MFLSGVFPSIHWCVLLVFCLIWKQHLSIQLLLQDNQSLGCPGKPRDTDKLFGQQKWILLLHCVQITLQLSLTIILLYTLQLITNIHIYIVYMNTYNEYTPYKNLPFESRRHFHTLGSPGTLSVAKIWSWKSFSVEGPVPCLEWFLLRSQNLRAFKRVGVQHVGRSPSNS